MYNDINNIFKLSNIEDIIPDAIIHEFSLLKFIFKKINNASCDEQLHYIQKYYI